MHALDPMHELWSDSPPAWIYRGQGDAEWRLVATALRSPTAFADFAVSGDPSGWSERRDMLICLLRRFGKRVDRAGVTVPRHNPKPDWKDERQMQSGADVDHKDFPLMALAQHHGLPTPLLDWTRRARNAAYFAAETAVRRDPKATHLALWALRGGHDRPVIDQRLILFFEAPHATNPNLRAQEGLFTWLQPHEDPPRSQNYVHLTIEDAVRLDGAARLRRLTLPVSEAPKLLRLLSYEGVDGARMFPGADGVARAMKELARWDKQDPEDPR